MFTLLCLVSSRELSRLSGKSRSITGRADRGSGCAAIDNDLSAGDISNIV
jgi:hypothetical protein